MADLASGLSADLAAALALAQRQIKYGLTQEAAIAFFEAGFADRIVATALADTFPNAGDRALANGVVRREPDRAQAALAPFPAYFTAVGNEITGG